MKAGKVWGETRLIAIGPNHELHRIEVEPGGYCSKHRHATKYNGFFCERGSMSVTTWKASGTVDETLLGPGDWHVAPPGEYHQFNSPRGCSAFELYWTELREDIDRENVGGLRKTADDSWAFCSKCNRRVPTSETIDGKCDTCWYRAGAGAVAEGGSDGY